MKRPGFPSGRRWRKRIGLLLCAGIVLLNLLAFSHVRAMTRFRTDGQRTLPPEALSRVQKAKVLLTGVSLPRPVTLKDASSLHPACEEVRIAGENVTLAAWKVDQGPDRPLVVWFHWYGAEKSSLIPEASAVIEEGASVLLVDFRGSGGSSESYTTIGVREAEDVRLAVDYVREQFPHTHLILAGKSMGGAAILRAVSEERVRPDGLVIEAVFDSLLETTRNRFRAMKLPSFPSAELLVFWGGVQWGYNGFRHNPARYAEQVNCPALFLHGHLDPRATWEEVQRVVERVPGIAELVGFPDCGHESYVRRDPERWLEAVRSLLQTVTLSEESLKSNPDSDYLTE